MVKVTIKSPSINEPLSVEFDPTTIGNVLALKELIGQKTSSPAAGMKLIHKGILFLIQEKFSKIKQELALSELPKMILFMLS